ncbi:Voltage-dependent calcium channel gamma-3 subunit [Bagarius yarrelli]|uniref:Voltage-dependent calcium channel gamma-3 subunit n=1 Tax=Bagarius yarrelli TaxID=175774 RepID=A0A556VWH8_BAGYA|nr:Voltage-dependent calcium channel gamma-3 subunit [Bagarius yarrelli]
MRLCNRGAQMLVTTAGAFTAFSLMTIAVGTDYWLYSPGVCRTQSTGDNETSQKNEEVLTHSGLWRQCCMEASRSGVTGTAGVFNCGALSFIMAETVGALSRCNLFIDSHRTRTFHCAPRHRVHASLQSRRSSSYRSIYRGYAHAHVLPRAPGGGRPPVTAPALAHYIKPENGLALHAHSYGVQHENPCALTPKKKCAFPPVSSFQRLHEKNDTGVK